MTTQPETTLDARYSSPGADPTPWEAGRHELAAAEIYWFTTVRPDGRPHCTPLIGVWLDDTLFICTGPEERKHRNLAENPNVVVTTGKNVYATGLDVVLEGQAEQVTDPDLVRRVADAYVAKYGEEWRFTPKDGRFEHHGGVADVFRVRSSAAYGYARGEVFSQTRWRF
jgi:nitroimidazol reductase NimA-like FMN-containing flavoprotein (pyridoxamine 5'-phosphate oxidase superfamily)